MVITILDQNYSCGSDRGIYYHEEKDILQKLNSVIDWEASKFPIRLKPDGDPSKVEDFIPDKTFLGETPQLKPGNMFFYDGNVFAIDREDKLILCISETGALSVDRFVKNILSAEYSMLLNNDVEQISYSKVDKMDFTGFIHVPVNCEKMKIFNNTFKSNHFDENDILKIVVEESDSIISPITMYITKWEVLYEPSEYLEEDFAPVLVDGVLSWFYKQKN